MDRTAWIVVALCTLGLVWLFITEQDRLEEAQKATATEQVGNSIEEVVEVDGETEPGPAIEAEETAKAEAAAPVFEPSDVSLRTDEVEYVFAELGGGIAEARMLTDANSAEDDSPVVINRFGRHAIGALAREPGEFEEVTYELEQLDERRVRATGELPGGLRVVKTWSLPEGELAKDGRGHLIRLELELTAPDGTALDSDGYSLGLGSIAPLQISELPSYTTLAWQSGGHHESEDINWFKGSKILWLFETRGPTETLSDNFEKWWWTGIMSQFYTTMINPVEGAGEVGGKVWAQRFPVELGEERTKAGPWALEAGANIGRLELAGGESTSRAYEFYIGPKNYSVLKRLGGERSEALDYGGLPVFGWVAAPFSKILNVGMNWIAGWFGQLSVRFALAIILLTIFIRTLMWPLHARAQRTMKKMAKLKPKMDELKEKYADDPQKLQQENMKLMSGYGVNPLGGCLPMLLQMPIFLGFYRMLFFAAELRHEPFLWVDDLSQPDTVASVMGIPINPLPLVMAGFSLLQLKLTPKTGDPTQRRIMYIMPAVMLVICYNFAAALALYWTVSNIFTIGQMLVMQRLPEPELKKTSKKTFAQRLEEMQAQRSQMMAARGAGGGGKPAKPKKSRPKTGG